MLPESILGGITLINMGLEAFFFTSEAPETKVNLFLGFVRPVTNSIHMVEGPGGHCDPSITPRMCFKVYNLMKQKPRRVFLD